MSTLDHGKEGQIADIRHILSPARLSTYEKAVRKHLNGPEATPGAALELYKWNAAISGAFLFPMQVCEVATRNAVSDVLTRILGPNWPWSGSFERSLKTKRREELQNACKAQGIKEGQTGKVVAELNFMFWQEMFTASFKEHIWNPHLHLVFPNMKGNNPEKGREGIWNDLRTIRILRNRIAHHEYIFDRRLDEHYQRIRHLIYLRCAHTAHWMDAHQTVTTLIAKRPPSCGW